jgi:hypothetical protein
MCAKCIGDISLKWKPGDTSIDSFLRLIGDQFVHISFFDTSFVITDLNIATGDANGITVADCDKNIEIDPIWKRMRTVKIDEVEAACREAGNISIWTWPGEGKYVPNLLDAFTNERKEFGPELHCSSPPGGFFKNNVGLWLLRRRRTGIKAGGRRPRSWRCKWWRRARLCLGPSIHPR